MKYTLSENKNYKGVLLFPKGTNVNVRKLDKNNNPIMTPVGIAYVVSTPNAFGEGTGRQITPPAGAKENGKPVQGWMEVRNALGFSGFVRFDLLTKVKPVSQITAGDGNAIIENIIARDKNTFHKILYNEELIKRLKGKGVKTGEFEKTHEAVKARYVARTRKIEDSKMLKLSRAIKPGFAWLTKPVSVSGIGVVQFGWVGALVIAGVAVGITAIALYNMFHTDATAAELDLKTATTLAALLEKVTPEEKKKVLAEINKQLQGQFEAGYTKGTTEAAASTVTSGFNGIKSLGFITLAIVALKTFA